jgi:fermentation-respiration switch protein FrsA (DUF1100 family)
MNKIEPAGGGWRNEVTLQSMLNLMVREPKRYIRRISPTPFLTIVPEKDTTVKTQAQLGMYQLGLEPKQISVVKDCEHFSIYGGGSGFDKNIEVQIEFLTRNL